MKEWIYFGIDLLEYLIQGGLLAYLLRGLLPPAERFRGFGKRKTEIFLILQFALIQMLLHHLPVARKWLYGSDGTLTQSRDGILLVLLSMGVSLIYCLVFYGGSRMRILYLVLTEYALSELVRFLLYTFFAGFLDVVMGRINGFLEEGNSFVIAHFMEIMQALEMLWNLLLIGCFMTGLYLVIRILKRHIERDEKKVTPLQNLFLLLPGITGLCFSILLRSVLYSVNGTKMHLFTDTNPEAYVLIPLISLLCIVSIILSAAILEKLIQNSEKEILLETYENQIQDMEEHMKDVEHLYDGIRGMKHDMKNYLADIEALLKEKEYPGGQEEVRRYLDGLYNSMEELDMKCKTGNPVTDVVLSRKIRESEAAGIAFECEFIYPEGMGISAFDLSIILNNALENALEASKKEGEGAQIRVESYRRENLFFLEIENYYTGNPKIDASGEFLKTTKEDKNRHGLGTKNIANSVKRYDGKLNYDYQNSIFALTVMLQGKEKEEKDEN